jgi:uncharacterized protein YyaL (SSP411 family)
MSATDENRLSEEGSPYLRQHEENPVNWQPWDEDALQAAEERDVPIFLSVGYSSCHWCHVMAEESFEDPGVAEILNEFFVPIKVDREERPDVDSVYQTICGAVTGQGGWPLSVWLTPEGKPFYVGTYFPRNEAHGRPGFTDLLTNIADSWTESREEIENRADQWADAISGELEETPESPEGSGAAEPPGTDLLTDAAGTNLRSADREHGGFGSGQKFPQTGRLHLLLRTAERTGRGIAGEVARETFDAMAEGGLCDHVGGGFHRYCTDREWVVPHFEKMLYDNAELARAYLAAYQATGEETYAEVARETFGFVTRELTHSEGGFYSTLDAQSVAPDSRREGGGGGEESADDAEGGSEGEREEGAFYVWTPAEIHEAVDDEESAELFCERFGITERGNFGGKSVLTVQAGIDQLADEHGTTAEEIEAGIERAREQVFAARAERPRPPRDEKILAGWNGLMIGAFAEGALVLGERYAKPAVEALQFCRERLWDESAGRLQRRYKDGEVKIQGYLEDYAFLARGALACYEATGEVVHLRFALDLARVIEAEFWDAEAGTLYFTPAEGESLVARPQELDDQSTPSSAGVACEVLLALSHFADHDRFAGIAEGVLATHADTIRADPRMRASLVLAADRRTTGWLECTVVADGLPEAWRERLGGTYLPDRLLSVRPPTEEGMNEWLDALDLEETPSIWANRTQQEGEPTVYVCRDFTCSPPQTDIEEALDWAAELAPGTESDAETDLTDSDGDSIL